MTLSVSTPIGTVCLTLWFMIANTGLGQQTDPASIAEEQIGEQAIILKSVPRPAPAFLYTANANSKVLINDASVEQTIDLVIRVVQGKPGTISLELNGPGDVKSVTGDSITAWSIRTQDDARYLDLSVGKDAEKIAATVTIHSPRDDSDSPLEIGHLGPGKSVGFNSIMNLVYAKGLAGRIVKADGFAPLATDNASSGATLVQTATGGTLLVELLRKTIQPPVELTQGQLLGELEKDGKSISLRLTGSVTVTQPDSRLQVLSGPVAISELPGSDHYRLRLRTESDKPAYELEFPKAGQFEIDLRFVAPLTESEAWQGVAFTVATSTVMPISLRGFGPEVEFMSAKQTIVPILDGQEWNAFLPATGLVNMHWRSARSAGQGKLFFTTKATIESIVGPGLLRQTHEIVYQILQGELEELVLELQGPGEIVDVQGENILAWQVSEVDDIRHLTIKLSQPLVGKKHFRIRSQTPFDDFPARVQGMVLKPVGALRHSGHLRLSNTGSVRMEPTDLSGLTQLAPEHFPGEKISARQLFVYRFPAADHEFTILADRIQPEVSLQQLLVYGLNETDRILSADLELDIREAAIREWNFSIPQDYSIVSVVGASVADYISATESTDGMRNLRVIFGQDVLGRQLISLRLEKSEPAAAGDWTLPRIEYPEAKTVRGDIGVVGAPGYRISSETNDLLVDKPLSTFPKPTPNLQQAFRIRDRNWSASVKVEQLQRSTQSDVFHLVSLSQGTVYGSALINFFVSGAPTSEWQIKVPSELGNLTVDGQDIRTWRREDDTLIVTLHSPIMGPYTLLITFEQKPDEASNTFAVAEVTPLNVQGDRGFVQVVSPMQVQVEPVLVSEELLVLDPLELPAEFRLLSTAPSLGTWQYTQRPFDLRLKVDWFEPGRTASQVVEFSEANSRVSPDGELVTDVVYFVKSRGQSTLRLQLPSDPVRLWSVLVNGDPVTARRSDDMTLIPLPGNADPNNPVEVSLRLGKPAVTAGETTLALPVVFAPVLKTQWNVQGDENQVIIPTSGTVHPTRPVLWPLGYDWLASDGLVPLVIIAGLGVLAALVFRNQTLGAQSLGVLCAGIAFVFALCASWDAAQRAAKPTSIRMSLPVLSSGEEVSLQVQNLPSWLAQISWPGLGLLIGGILVTAGSTGLTKRKALVRLLGITAALSGLLLIPNGAIWVYLLIAIFVGVLQLIPFTRVWLSGLASLRSSKAPNNSSASTSNSSESTEGDGSPSVAPTILAFVALGWASTASVTGLAADSGTEFLPADSITQSWNITSQDSKLLSSGTVSLSGKPGDQFILLKAPAVLTKFEGSGLRVSKTESSDQGTLYIVSIVYPTEDEKEVASDTDDADSAETDEVQPSPEVQSARDDPDEDELSNYDLTFEYRLEAVKPNEGIQVLTGPAAIQTIQLRFDDSGWDVLCPSAAQITTQPKPDSTEAFILLRAGDATISLRPKARDLQNEETKFFVEGSQLYTVGPGVVDGRHSFEIRTSQGQVKALEVSVPADLTVSDVRGPVSTWQYDAENQKLKLELKPVVEPSFQITVETQRAIDSLPTDLTLAQLQIENSGGEVGLLAIAFSSDAQPESVESQTLPQVNLSDFSRELAQESPAVLHKVFRYGSDSGEIAIRVAPVSPEIRVASRQILSLGDERIVLAVNFAAEISRTGLFQLSFPLPNGLEVESLSGDALHHWSEVAQDGQRRIVLHLNGKTIGTQKFALSLAGPAPSDSADWEVPRFVLTESQRQSGELFIRPITGIRLRAVSRQNVSETDPRSLGSQQPGGLAFRLLQKEWNLIVGIERLDPWVTGQVLHDITMREGQTRSTLFADFQIENASIRSLTIRLPITNPDELGTVRASGSTVSDFVPVAADSDLWELKLKRRVIGRLHFQIEYERRGERSNNTERLNPIGFPTARQTAYYYALRAGGRLEIEPANLTQGWQRADWNTIPPILRQNGNPNAPALALRALEPPAPLAVQILRHSLAESLKLRVAKGELTTVLSPNGDQLTAVELSMEVIQRSSLNVTLPDGGELFNIFVNGESVHSIRQTGTSNGWQFYILPGINDRTATVRFVYLLTGDNLSELSLTSPQLNVPLENVTWQVVAPEGHQLSNADGNLELVDQTRNESYNRQSYLSKVSGRREVQAQQAADLLEQASVLLQAGEQTKARRALSNVANRYALDAASNEDARVQLENLQTQQAIVGLNTRRQRLYLDNSLSGLAFDENEQLRQAAVTNPILQQEAVNFRPQELSQLLAGNSVADNAVLQQIAARLVTHQRTTEPAPQAITISLPEEGTTYKFSRGVQVAEDAPLQLELGFQSRYTLLPWQWMLIGVLILAIASSVSLSCRQTVVEQQST